MSLFPRSVSTHSTLSITNFSLEDSDFSITRSGRLLRSVPSLNRPHRIRPLRSASNTRALNFEVISTKTIEIPDISETNTTIENTVDQAQSLIDRAADIQAEASDQLSQVLPSRQDPLIDPDLRRIGSSRSEPLIDLNHQDIHFSAGAEIENVTADISPLGISSSPVGPSFFPFNFEVGNSDSPFLDSAVTSIPDIPSFERSFI